MPKCSPLALAESTRSGEEISRTMNAEKRAIQDRRQNGHKKAPQTQKKTKAVEKIDFNSFLSSSVFFCASCAFLWPFCLF
jgi:hypothetical protein